MGSGSGSQSVIDEHRVATGPQIVLHLIGRLDEEPERSVADAAAAVVRESLSNAVRHAAATSVVVDLEVDVDGLLRIVVADDGAGFDREHPAEGNGLPNLEARANELGVDASWSRVLARARRSPGRSRSPRRAT